MKKELLLASIVMFSINFASFSQSDSLLNMLDEETELIKDETGSFKSTRVINLHSVEQVGKGILDFRISHRFGRINSGEYNFFGLDQASIRLALEYGITKKLMIGIGRSSFEKVFDGFLKYTITNRYFSMVWLSSLNYVSQNFANPNRNNLESARLSYIHQLLVAKRISEKLSLQFVPTLVHRNFVETKAEANDVYFLSLAGRYKISKRVAITAEYNYTLPGYTADNFYDSFSVGVDIETGGHVFQLHCTNSQGMIESYYLARTDGSWERGDIYFGFNVSRVFTLNKKKRGI
ncbi:MAG: hypothetical protein EAZ55_08610 [Cytophagales bacterium]|nr:MAG: hypothetical protein EAZ55_08610 [Cytophagales bacterium]